MLKGTLFKWIVVIGSVSILVASAGVLYFVNYKPQAPLLSGINLSSCAPSIDFLDNSTNEEDFRVYRRVKGAPAFQLIYILRPLPGKGIKFGIGDVYLPLGAYEYRVSAFNAIGESFSNIETVIVGDCSGLPGVKITPLNNAVLPFPPLIMDLSVVNNCNVRITYRDNSTNEQGLRVYRDFSDRSGSYGVMAVIANLGIHNGIPGSFTDTAKLSPGYYLYRMSSYNQNGEAFGYPYEIKLETSCNPTYQSLPTKVITPALAVTLQKLSCDWEAAADVFLRKGPDVGLFDRLIDVQKGKTYPIVGQSEDGQFWAVEVEPGIIGYITKSEKYSRINGDCGTVSTLTDPEPPEVIPAATKKPGEPAGPAACGDGVDNDGDGFVDYNPDPAAGDPGCSSSADTSE